jgi:hypothetical protein
MSTGDLNLVAYLMTQGHNPKIIPGQTFHFEFPDSPEIEAAAKDFVAGNTSVDAKHFASKVKILRSVIASMKGGK